MSALLDCVKAQQKAAAQCEFVITKASSEVVLCTIINDGYQYFNTMQVEKHQTYPLKGKTGDEIYF